MSRIDICVPELGEASPQAVVSRWLRTVGDRVAAGDVLVELQTDKVDTEIAAEADGWLAEIHASRGATVVSGERIASLETTPGIVPSAPVAPPGPPAVRCLRCGAPMEPASTSLSAFSLARPVRVLVCRACGHLEMVAEDPRTF